MHFRHSMDCLESRRAQEPCGYSFAIVALGMAQASQKQLSPRIDATSKCDAIHEVKSSFLKALTKLDTLEPLLLVPVWFFLG